MDRSNTYPFEESGPYVDFYTSEDNQVILDGTFTFDQLIAIARELDKHHNIEISVKPELSSGGDI